MVAIHDSPGKVVALTRIWFVLFWRSTEILEIDMGLPLWRGFS